MSAVVPNPDVRVVCVVFHPGDELATFARTLTAASTHPVELVIVDNGTDQSVSRAVADEFGARLLVTGANLGYGGGANAGAEGCVAPWILVANSDLEWEPGSLDALVAAADADARAGSAGPALLNPDGTVYPSARALPSLSQGAGHALFVRVWPGNPWTRRYRAEHETTGQERAAGWLSGACLLLRRQAFEAVAGFDDDYFMFFEDVDLGDRLGRAGWLNVYVPDAEVVHTGGHATERDAPTSSRMLAEHHRSAYRFLADRYRGARWAPVRFGLRVGLGLRARTGVRAAP